MINRPAHIMILTGEPSGDFHAAPLIRSLKKMAPEIRVSGIGGPAMAGQGADVFFPIDRLSAMGLIQVIRQFSSIKQAFGSVKHRLKTDRPDAVVLIDYPGFNLRIAKYIKENYDIPVCYYIAPKVWAWNSGRLKKIRAFTDHVALILPFERSIYKKMNIPATYVGNPLMDEYPHPPLPRAGDRAKDEIIIGLLPGSRSSEIENLLPVMLDSAGKIAKQIPGTRFIVSSGAVLHEKKIRDIVTNHPCRDLCRIVSGRPGSIFKQADMIIAASGTVTLEAGLCGVPTIIIYKLSALAYGLGKLLVKIKYAGLANLIVGREVMPERLQSLANPEEISQTAFSMISELDVHRKNLEEVRRRLGTPGAPERTAKLILNFVKKRTSVNTCLTNPDKTD